VISRFAWLAKLFAIFPEQGAEAIVYLASSPAVAETTGEYFYKRQPIEPSPAAQDDRAASLLWERSAALAGLKARERVKTPRHRLNGNVASANKQIPRRLGSAMRVLIHCSGWKRTALLTSIVKERDVTRTSNTRGRIHQRSASMSEPSPISTRP